MVAFTGFSNEGYNNFANSLSGLGQTLGNAYLKNQERQLLSDIGSKIQSGDHKGAADIAFQAGDTATAVNLLKLADEQDRRNAQQAADANVLASINGPVAQNTQGPMNLTGSVPANDEVGKYIVQAAQARGIDPNVALQVWRSEGKGGYVGDNGSSFGPLQLHYGGVAKGGNSVPGLGDEFTKQTGLDARNPDTWKQQIDFSLDKAKTGGWTPWHGWKGDPMAGIGGQPPRVQVADASGNIPQSANIDALMNRRNTIMRALSSQGISDNARQQLNTQLQDTTFQIERADRMANQNKPEVRQFGNTVYNITGGQMSPVMKIPEAEKPANQDQGAAQTFATRMREAENIINSVDQNKKPVWQDAVGREGIKNSALDKIPLAGRGMVSENYQRYTDAKERFITSILRDESGATIGTDEFMREERKYFPQPNDKPATIRDKAIARQNAISTLAKQGTPQFQREFFGEGNSQNQSAKTVSGEVKSAKPIPSNVLDEARAAIPRKGRDAVINLLRQQGFDTTGL
jgi:hypothetical protein